MRNTIKELIEKNISSGLTNAQARSFVAQQIILSKIEQSKYVDKVLLKGGVVMYNITHERRRTTLDLDFDFIKVDINHNNGIKEFINNLNKTIPEYRVQLSGAIEDLHQQDYKGKRIKIIVSDDTESINFKMDIGVHTLLAIDQNKMCFSFSGGEDVVLLVNPPEQIFAEKLFSLAKIGPTSQRFRDIDNMFYLISTQDINKKIVKQCLSLLTINQPYDLKDEYDVVSKADECLNDSFFSKNYSDNNGSWLNIKYETAKNTIIDFIYKL